MRTAAQASGDDATSLMAHRCMGVVRFFLADHAEACRNLERAIELYRDGEHAPLAQRFAFDPKAAALGFLGLCLVVLGRTAEAQRRFAEALAHAHAQGHLVTLANTLAHVGLGRIVAGDEAGVRAVADTLSRIAAEQSFPYWTAHAAIQRGWLLLADRAGLDAFREGIAVYRASGARMAVPTLLAIQAAAHLRHGEAEDAGTLLDEARRLTAETGERWYEPELVRLSGEVLAARGRRAEAESELREAVRLAERQGARLWRRRALASLRRLRPGPPRQRGRAIPAAASH
jgi:predicted ATPase